MASTVAMGGPRLWRSPLLVLGAVLFVSLTVFAAGAGADGFVSPNDNVSLNLGVGSSKTTHTTVHFDAAPAKADILLALDTTGSMGSAITDAKNDASNIVTDIKASIPGAKFAVVNFKDYPTLLEYTPDPLGDWASGRTDRLARAELASVGLTPG